MVIVTWSGDGVARVLILHADGVSPERLGEVRRSIMDGSTDRFEVVIQSVAEEDWTAEQFDVVAVYHPGTEPSPRLLQLVEHPRLLHVLSDDRVFRGRELAERPADPPDQIALAGLEAIMDWMTGRG